MKRHLSFRGKASLIKSILSTLALFYLRFFYILVVKELKKI